MDKPEAPREKQAVAEAFERVWSQALLAVSTAEEEVNSALQRVAATAGWSPDEVKRHAREFTERLAGQRKALEHSAEVAVRGALGKVNGARLGELAGVE